MYADDICLMAPSAITLQKMLNLCYEFSQSNDIMFNPIKSQCMVFKPNRLKLYCPAVYLNGNIIDSVEKTKYLGYMFTNDKQDDVETLHKIDASTHPSPLCPLCRTHEHTTQHLFSCPQIRTTLSALDLWRDPSSVAALHAR